MAKQALARTVDLEPIDRLEEKIGLLAPRMERGHAAMRGLKEIARVAQGVAEGLLRVADVFQMCGQIVDEFECGEFPLHRQPVEAGL